MSRYRHVDAMKAEGFPIAAACRAAEVARSAYYAWKAAEMAGPTSAELEEAYLVNAIIDLHAGSDATYGSPRVTKELHRRGYCVNHKRTERLMAANGIVGVAPRRFVRTTLPAGTVPKLPDLVCQDFSTGAPNLRYCGDITYVATGEGWLYLASVLDLGSRRLAGWEMADHMRTELVSSALERALELRGSLAGALFHSDLGAQGGFNWLSQHLRVMEVSGGSTAAAGRSGSTTGDAFAWAADPGSACGARVLASDRAGETHRGGGDRDRCVHPRRVTLVSSRWRHAAIEPGRADRPLSVVQRA